MRCARKQIINLNEAAAKHVKVFRVFHTWDSIMHRATNTLRLTRFRFIAALIWLLPSIILGATLGFITPHPWGIFTNMAVIAATFYPIAVHMKYQVFCPWCRKRPGDDDTEHEPTPDPVGTATA